MWVENDKLNANGLIGMTNLHLQALNLHLQAMLQFQWRECLHAGMVAVGAEDPSSKFQFYWLILDFLLFL